MVCYQDDIYIEATKKNEVKKKSSIILNRLRNTEMKINEKKKNAWIIVVKYHF